MFFFLTLPIRVVDVFCTATRSKCTGGQIEVLYHSIEYSDRIVQLLRSKCCDMNRSQASVQIIFRSNGPYQYSDQLFGGQIEGLCTDRIGLIEVFRWFDPIRIVRSMGI